MTEFFSSPYTGPALFAVFAFGLGFFGVTVIKKNRHVSQLPDEDFPQEFDVIQVGLCATQAGKKTHYRTLGKAGLHKRVTGKPTLCGVKAHHDLEDQDAEATCQTCNNALVKFGYPFI